MKLPALVHLKRWTRPDCYIGSEWSEYFVFLAQHRDSDTLSRSNFASGLAAIGGETETVFTIRENHWAVGWVEWIAIHETDAATLAKAEAVLGRLENYPVVDEEHWSQLESNEADEVWARCYSVSGRLAYVRAHRSQFEFRDFADMLDCIRGRYFAGYASELLT